MKKIIVVFAFILVLTACNSDNSTTIGDYVMNTTENGFHLKHKENKEIVTRFENVNADIDIIKLRKDLVEELELFGEVEAKNPKSHISSYFQKANLYLVVEYEGYVHEIFLLRGEIFYELVRVKRKKGDYEIFETIEELKK